MSEKHSVPSGGSFNARVAPEEKPVSKPQREGPIVPAVAASRYMTKASELTPSEHRGTDINTDAIRDSVARMLAKHDRDVATSNGVEDWRVDAARLNESVRKGEITSEQAAAIWKIVHPSITDADLRGAQ
jgi:hypothetical protein